MMDLEAGLRVSTPHISTENCHRSVLRRELQQRAMVSTSTGAGWTTGRSSLALALSFVILATGVGALQSVESLPRPTASPLECELGLVHGSATSKPTAIRIRIPSITVFGPRYALGDVAAALDASAKQRALVGEHSAAPRR